MYNDSSQLATWSTAKTCFKSTGCHGYRWLEMINEHGLCVLEGVPTEDGMVAEVCTD